MKIFKTISDTEVGGGIRGIDIKYEQVQPLVVIQERVKDDLMRHPGVFATAVGLGDHSIPVLQVYVDEGNPGAEETIRIILEQLKDVRTEIYLQEKFKPQICLGVSGGLAFDFSQDLENSNNDSCCSGTLGCLVLIGGTQYVLSNWHVLEANGMYFHNVCDGRDDPRGEPPPDPCTGGYSCGGDNNKCGQCNSWIDLSRPPESGDPVICPGSIDVGCTFQNAHIVGFLEKRDSLPGGNVDCAVARIRPGILRADGWIEDIGVISSTIASAVLGLPVQKTGRTTGHTTGTITSISLSTSISYSHECGGGSAFSNGFTAQLGITGDTGLFSDAGDSGSLVVTSGESIPKPVGLLFAGGGGSTVANPIGDVLSFLGATIVGI